MGFIEKRSGERGYRAVDGRAPEGGLAGSPCGGSGLQVGIDEAAGGPATVAVEADIFVGGDSVMLSGAQRAEDHAGLPRLLDVNEVAEVLGVNVRHVRRLVF